jgi:hypothetical protein
MVGRCVLDPQEQFYALAQLLSKIAEETCAPFWWSIQKNPPESLWSDGMLLGTRQLTISFTSTSVSSAAFNVAGPR